MQDSASCFFLGHAVSPIHAGAGEGDGIKGNPIQREADSGTPIIDSTGWKGAVKFLTDGDDKIQGKIVFSNLKLMFFPVRSSKGGHALITSCKVLRTAAELFHIYKPEGYEQYEKSLNTLAEKNFIGTYGFTKGPVQLGDVTYIADEIEIQKENHFLTDFPLITNQLERIFIIPDEDFDSFTQLETECNMRIKVDAERRTAEEKKLFLEEYLPEESILYGFVTIFQDIHNLLSEAGLKEELNNYTGKIPDEIQIGAGLTLGKGRLQLCRGGK